jgi:Mrp family chromosome partitioning ATPase
MDTLGAQREAARQPAAAPNASSIGETQPDTATAYVGAQSVHTAGKELDAAVDVPAAWEVDRFAWPADCQKLVRCLGQELLEAGRELVAAAQRGVRCIAITGAHRGEGRTTVCMLLAYAAARAGARVALIEADLDNPRISALLELQPPFDWRSAYRYSQPFDEAAVYSVEDKIVILPLLGQSGDSPQQPAPDTWQQLLAQWGAKYFDLILVDLGVWDTAITRYLPSECGRLFQAVLVVCDVRSTAAGSLEALVRDILNQGIESVGMIENFVGPETA